MRVLQINSVCGIRSTGRICTDIAKELEAQGHEVKIAYGRVDHVPQWAEKFAVRIGTDLDLKLHAIGTRLFDRHGFYSVRATKRFLKWADSYDPDLLWLHNIHGYYINIELLFQWIKSRPQMKVKWTLHDCWAFTGHCAYFDYVQCGKWKTGCCGCPQKTSYPTSMLLCNSAQNYRKKETLFTGVKDLTIITPSEWLKDLVKESFLSEYTVTVVHNTIDTQVFCPTPSDFRKQYGLENKKIVLGVASSWSRRKGIQDFFEMSQHIGPEIKIVLVGLDDEQMNNLPANILGIKKTNSTKSLAEIYTAADVFFNPTYEDNYPTVNLEAQACGTKVITYRTGGSPETLYKENAIVVEKGDWKTVLSMLKE